MTIDRPQLVAMIAEAVSAAGGMASFSRRYDLAEPYVYNVLCGRTPPAKRICAVVGVVPVSGCEWRMIR